MTRMVWIGLVVTLALAGQTPGEEVKALGDAGQAPVLAGRWLAEGRVRAAAMGVMLGTGNESERQKARAVLNDLEEQALPVLAGARGLRPADEAWRLRMLAEELGEWRRKAARVIDGQLGNREVVPRAGRRVGERKAPERRVCDEAYAAVVELLRGSEAMEREMRGYWAGTAVQREGLIRATRAGAGWKELLVE